jgi:hypothetical protein
VYINTTKHANHLTVSVFCGILYLNKDTLCLEDNVAELPMKQPMVFPRYKLLGPVQRQLKCVGETYPTIDPVMKMANMVIWQIIASRLAGSNPVRVIKLNITYE